MIERPLDLLNSLKGKKIIIKCKEQADDIVGKLIAFDIHINLVVDIDGYLTFIRGDTIISVS
jgi:small nuclear ribonucleoprotein (snRNP)-like protein